MHSFGSSSSAAKTPIESDSAAKAPIQSDNVALEEGMPFGASSSSTSESFTSLAVSPKSTSLSEAKQYSSQSILSISVSGNNSTTTLFSATEAPSTTTAIKNSTQSIPTTGQNPVVVLTMIPKSQSVTIDENQYSRSVTIVPTNTGIGINGNASAASNFTTVSTTSYVNTYASTIVSQAVHYQNVIVSAASTIYTSSSANETLTYFNVSSGFSTDVSEISILETSSPTSTSNSSASGVPGLSNYASNSAQIINSGNSNGSGWGCFCPG